ncbi:MAG: alanine racemase [Chloroflexota bacterium]
MTEIGQPYSSLDTPFLWTDLDIVESNIAIMARLFEETKVNWRPHTKGIKIPAIAHKAIAAGAIGVTCAKLGEAEIMAAAGIKDILIANQIVGPHKLARLVHLQHQADVKVAVDDAGVASQLSAAAQAAGVEVGVLVEVNTGMNRAGTAPGQAAVALSQKILEMPGLRYDGLMAWEGHALANPDPDGRKAAIEESLGLFQKTIEACQSANLPLAIISGGGSGSTGVTPFLGVVTEMQSGGALFSDTRYHAWWDGTTPSIFVRAMVTSRPTPERILFDAGFKTLPRWAGEPEVLGIDHVKSFSTSAEHGVMTLTQPNETIQIGDSFDFIIGYGDSTVFLHDHLYGVRKGMVEAVWPVSGRGKLR